MTTDMARYHNIIIALSLQSLLIGCASHTFKVESDPIQAEVFIQKKDSEEKVSIGKTPIDLSMSSVRDTVGEETLSGEFFTLSVEKEGYTPQTLSIPVGGFGTLVTSLNVKMIENNGKGSPTTAKKILDHLYLAQKLAKTKEFERAQIEIDKILEVDPKFARAMSMRGSIYFVQKNFPEAKKWYQKALEEEPKLDEAVEMLGKMKDTEKGASEKKGEGT